MLRLSGCSLLAVVWLKVLLWATLADSRQPIKAAALLLPDGLENRITAAVASATKTADNFTRMRNQLGGTGALGEAIAEHLDSQQHSLLNGSTPASEALNRRFRTMQLEGMELSRQVADDDEPPSVDVRNFTEALERLAEDLTSHLTQVRESLVALCERLPTDVRSKVEGVLSASDDSATSVAAGEDVSTVSAELARLNSVAKQLADRGDTSMLSEARRLGARFAREGTQRQDAAEFNNLRQIVRDALARAEKLLKFMHSGKHPQRNNLQSQRRGRESKSFSWRPGTLCTIDDVNSAAANFDFAVREFHGPLKKALLPPEVENLQRVIHTMQVMKNTLLTDLRRGTESEVLSADGTTQNTLVATCQKYFAGVGQMENDINHFKGLLQQQKQKKKKRRQGKSDSILPQKRPALSAQRF